VAFLKLSATIPLWLSTTTSIVLTLQEIPPQLEWKPRW